MKYCTYNLKNTYITVYFYSYLSIKRHNDISDANRL